MSAASIRARSVTYNSIASYARDVINQIRTTPDSFPLQLTVRLPSLMIDVSAFPGELAESIEQNLHPCPQTPAANERMKVFLAHPGLKGIPAPAHWAEREPRWSHDIAEMLAASGLRASYFYDLDHWHIYDPAARVAVQLMRAPGDYPAWEPSAPLRPFLHWFYAGQGKRLAHCGTLGADGVGVLLAGPGGSGKSATVIAGVLNGLQSVGDDYVLIESHSEIVARPIFGILKQDPEGIHRLGLSGLAGERKPNWQGKLQFAFSDIARQPMPDQISIKAMLVPQFTGNSRTSLAALSRSEAMIALAATSIHQMPGERESGFRFFSDVTKRVACYRLGLGHDPSEISAAIERFIRELPHES